MFRVAGAVARGFARCSARRSCDISAVRDARAGITIAVALAIGVHFARFQPEQIVQAFRPDLRFHDHAGAAADRGIVHGMMHVMRPIAQIVGVDTDEPLALRFAEQA